MRLVYIKFIYLLKLVLLDSKLTDLLTSRLRLTLRTEPVDVAKFWDDLLVGVKGQSRLVIASSPRNIYKYRSFEYLRCNYMIGYYPFNLKRLKNSSSELRLCVSRRSVERETAQITK